MQRSQAIARINSESGAFDVLVIGGGATGFACALDALSRGYSVVLVERGDFGEGTSSRSTKLIHGGVRYLRQGNIKLVRESLRERQWFFRAAPHLVQPLELIIPCRTTIGKFYYRTGMAVYDAMARTDAPHRAATLSAEEVRSRVPGCSTNHLRGGVRYMDGQFDDARMIVCFLRQLLAGGGLAINYAPVVDLLKEKDRVCGVFVEDRAVGSICRIRARAIINATGVFTDGVCQLDEPGQPEKITASQGIHLVLDGSFLGGRSALMIPETSDGRILFAIPWHGRVLLGTTDTPWPDASKEPKPLAEEIDYLLEHARGIFSRAPVASDILGVFAGLRPLPKSGKKTSAISRDFRIDRSSSGLISIYGGKWTTCRAMGEAAIDVAIRAGGLEPRPSRTCSMQFAPGVEPSSHLEPPDQAWVDHAVKNEMAFTLPDLLFQRSRLGLLDARAARAAAPDCARWMAGALHQSDSWASEQISRFNEQLFDAGQIC